MLHGSKGRVREHPLKNKLVFFHVETIWIPNWKWSRLFTVMPRICWGIRSHYFYVEALEDVGGGFAPTVCTCHTNARVKHHTFTVALTDLFFTDDLEMSMWYVWHIDIDVNHVKDQDQFLCILYSEMQHKEIPEKTPKQMSRWDLQRDHRRALESSTTRRCLSPDEVWVWGVRLWSR